MLQEKAAKNQRNPMLFWESKLIHKMRGKSKFYELSSPGPGPPGLAPDKSPIFLFWLFHSACVPGLYYIGTDTSVANMQFHVMVMDLLGPSLEDLF